MTARENPAGDRMAGAAARRPDRAREPGRTAIRAKPVRVTAGLDPATSTGLNRWGGQRRGRGRPGRPAAAAGAGDPRDDPRTTAGEAVTSAVIEQLRQGQD